METERLILRGYKESDLQDYFEYISNPEVVRFEPYEPMSLEAAREAHLQENVFFWRDEKGQPIWKDTYIYTLLNH